MQIFELDWERLDSSFGVRGKFLQRYSNTLIAEKAKVTSCALVEAFKAATGAHNSNLISPSHVGRIYRIGNVVGAAAALGEVYKIDPNVANQISGVVSAPIGFENSNLLTEIATFN